VTLQANNTGFKGFLLQARDEKGPVGTFTVLGNNSQLLSCGTEVNILLLLNSPSCHSKAV